MPKGGIKITSSVLNKLVKTEDLHVNYSIIIYRSLNVIATTLLRPLQLRGHPGNSSIARKAFKNRSPVPCSSKVLCWLRSGFDCLQWTQPLARLTLEIKSGCLFCVSLVPHLSTERYFHFHVPKIRLYSKACQAFFREKSWNKMSHLTDYPNKQDLTSVTLSQVIKFFPLLISITHWHFTFLYFTRRVRARLHMK